MLALPPPLSPSLFFPSLSQCAFSLSCSSQLEARDGSFSPPSVLLGAVSHGGFTELNVNAAERRSAIKTQIQLNVKNMTARRRRVSEDSNHIHAPIKSIINTESVLSQLQLKHTQDLIIELWKLFSISCMFRTFSQCRDEERHPNLKQSYYKQQRPLASALL